ncbi:hypothetical protein NBRC10513v2_000562 [Rhodotorula toruloides]
MGDENTHTRSSSSSTASSLNSTSSRSKTTRESDAHLWAEGRKALKPVQVGEQRRSQGLRMKNEREDLANVEALSTTSEGEAGSLSAAAGKVKHIVDENKRLKQEIADLRAERDAWKRNLDDLRYTLTTVAAERDAAKLDVAQHEDELLILRQTHEDRATEVAELRKAKEFAEAERAVALDSLSQLKAQHELEQQDLKAELVKLSSRLEKVEGELVQTQADQEEQHDACMQLMEEQEKLELAYEAALSELNEHKRRCGEAVPDEQLAGDEESDLDADASWQDIDPAETVPAVQAWPTKRGSGRRRLVSKRRIGPPQLISSTSLQTNSDVRLVKNDVEQLKQTLALLVQERRNSLASESLVGKQST